MYVKSQVSSKLLKFSVGKFIIVDPDNVSEFMVTPVEILIGVEWLPIHL